MTANGAAFVTGGNGIVGQAVVRRLVTEGRQVRALTRSEESAGLLRQLGAEPVLGDVLEPETLDRGLAGCEVAFHVAGVNRFCLKDPSPMYRANVTGSANVIEAVARAGIRRVVYTSSAVTLGERRGTIGSEVTPHRGTFLSSYERSKFEAERVVFNLARRRDVDLVSVNPSSVQGPGRATGTGQLLIWYLRGSLRAWVDTTISLVDIDDCAEGHVRAETHGCPGERYVLNAESLDTGSLLALLQGVTSVATTPRIVPRPMAAAAAAAAEMVARVRGRTPIVCRESLRTLLHGHRYDGTKAERDLGLRYRTVAETLRRTAAWLADEGLVPPSAVAP